MPEILITGAIGFVDKAVIQPGELQAWAALIAELKDCVRNDE
jgi:hypothetical protein